MSEEKEANKEAPKDGNSFADLMSKYGTATLGLWVGGALMVIGTLMAWAKSVGYSASGMDADGEFTLIAGIVIAAVGALPFLRQISLKLTEQTSYWVVLVAAFYGGAYLPGDFAGDLRDASSAFGGLLSSASPSVGLGVWLAMLGGLLAVLATGLLKNKIKVESVSDAKKMDPAKQKLLLVPAGIYLLLFFFLYI